MPPSLALGIEDPGARLLAAVTEQAVKDLAQPAEAEDAAEFLREIAPVLWGDLGITAAQVDAMIAHRRQNRYNVLQEARQLEGSGYLRHGRLTLGKTYASPTKAT